jgi:hypothetical protein
MNPKEQQRPSLFRRESTELRRLNDAQAINAPWKKWGPYLNERQWGTVREDYSGDGDAWNYFTHDQARSRAYHWGEDGMAGISDGKQLLCFSVALWNGKDRILKERMFGLTNSEGSISITETTSKVECPTRSGKLMNLFEVAQGLSVRLEGIFLRDKSGRHPVLWRHGEIPV